MILMQPKNMVSRVSRSLVLTCFCAALGYGQASQQQTAPATLAVSGDIPSQLVLKAEDLAKMPRETVSIPEQDGTKVEYEGVPLREILKRAGAPVEKELRGKALASYVLAKAHDGYQVIFTLAEVAPEFANEPITGGRQARRKTAVRIPGSVPAGVPERQGRRPLGTHARNSRIRLAPEMTVSRHA